MEQREREILEEAIQSGLSSQEFAKQISNIEGRPFYVARDVTLGESKSNPNTVERRVDIQAEQYIKGRVNHYSFTYEMTLGDEEIDEEMKPYLN